MHNISYLAQKTISSFCEQPVQTTLRYIKETDLAPINLRQLFFDLHTVACR